MEKLKSYLGITFKIVLAAGLIYWMISKGLLDLGVFNLIATPFYVTLCFALIIINLSFANARWKILLAANGVDRGFFELLRLTLIGIFFNFAMPGGVGGDVVKGYYIVKDHPEQKLASAMSILMDRFLGLFSMVIMGTCVVVVSFFTMEANAELKALFWGVIAIFMIFIFAGLTLFSRRIRRHPLMEMAFEKLPGGETLARIYDTAQFYLRKPTILFSAIALSVMAHSTIVVFFMVIAGAMGLENIPIAAYIFAVPLGLIATALPISPAGVGVGQAAMLFFFNSYIGTSTQLGPNGLTVYQVCMLSVGLLGAFFYLQRKQPIPEQVSANG